MVGGIPQPGVAELHGRGGHPPPERPDGGGDAKLDAGRGVPGQRVVHRHPLDRLLAARLSAHGSASFDVHGLAGLCVDVVPGGGGQSLLPSWLVKRLASASMVSSSSASILACRLAAIWSRRAAACCSCSAAWCPAW